MKKVFFTAIAMIAFSSASMANTIAEEEVVVNKEEKKEVVAKKDCFAFALLIYDIVDPNNTMNDEDASTVLNNAYHYCTTH